MDESPLVCIVTTVHRVMDTRIFRKQARTLAGAGYRVVYLAPHSHDEVVEGVAIHALPRRGVLARLLALPGVFRRALAVDADVYHLHDPELVLVGWWLHLAGRRVIYDAHEDTLTCISAKVYLPRSLAPAIARLVDGLEKRLARQLDVVIGATEAIVARFVGANVHLVKNYPIIDPRPALPPPTRPAEAGLHAIYVGDLTRVRGILEIVQAVERIDSACAVRLTVVGSFPHPDFEAEVRAAAGGRVTFTGFLPYEEATAHRRAADVGLVCFQPIDAHLEALPNKLFEYMDAGLPIIASDFPLWHELVVETGCGVGVDPLDPDAIAAALLELAADPERRRTMSQRGQQLVRESLNWDTQARVLLAVYATLVGAPAIRSAEGVIGAIAGTAKIE